MRNFMIDVWVWNKNKHSWEENGYEEKILREFEKNHGYGVEGND